MRGVAQERDATFRPLPERLAVADRPPLEVLAGCPRHQRYQRFPERRRQPGRVRGQILGERLVVRPFGQHPPLVAAVALVTDRRVAALRIAIVCDHSLSRRMLALDEQVAADQVEVLLADGPRAPEALADGRVDPVGTD